MDFEEYRSLICNGLDSAIQVPFVVVALGDWRPGVGDCHRNVDRWVRRYPSHTFVRGWVTVATDGGTGIFLTHHSVVRGKDGCLFDITPIENESIRKTMRFVPHIGSESEFFRFKDLVQVFLDCEMSCRP